MEEIYQPYSESEKIELYTRDNNDILGDLPHWLIHTGSYIVYSIIILLFLGSALFKYPDVINKHILINDANSVEWITANNSGIIDRFFVENESSVSKNDTIGILKNTASFGDVKKFTEILTNVEWYYRTNNPIYLQKYPFNLIMGEMTPAYEKFTHAVRTCVMYHDLNFYSQKEKYIKEELKILSQNEKANELAILKNRRELFELAINHKIEMAKNRKLIEIAYEDMINYLKAWDAKYLIKCSNNGTIILGENWGMDELVNKGDTLCTVISSKQGRPMGHMKLSQNEMAEVQIGNKVNIELAKYPVHTYGYLSGEVVAASYIPHTKNYQVEVKLLNGLTTTNNKQLKYTIDLTGEAEIITSSRSILSRIFNPIYQLFKK